jgi:CRP-like cAMP-binding protein
MNKELPDRCKYCLHDTCIFLDLSRSDQSFRPEDFTHQLTFRKGQAIFSQGAPVYGYYVICEGIVKLIRHNSAQSKVIVALMGPGDILGLEAKLHGEFQLEAEALEETRVGFIDKGNFSLLLGKYPRLGAALVEKLSEEICRLQEQLASTTRRGSLSRVAHLLLQLAKTYGKSLPQGTLIDLKLTGAEMAEMAGLTRETVSLAISQLVKRGFISKEENLIVIHDCSQLEQLL